MELKGNLDSQNNKILSNILAFVSKKGGIEKQQLEGNKHGLVNKIISINEKLTIFTSSAENRGL